MRDLIERSGTPRETIHFYLREGLLPKPKKVSRNLAYYDESHVERLAMIKKLRNESYLPLQVIKKVLKEGRLASSPQRLDFAEELLGHDARVSLEPLTKKQLAERTGLSERSIAAAEAAGVLRPEVSGKTRRYGKDDVRAAELLKRAEDEAGPGGERVVIERFAMMDRHAAALVNEEIEHYFTKVVPEGNPRRALDLLSGGQETSQKYLTHTRARTLRAQVDGMLPAILSVFEHQPALRLHLLPSEEEREALGEHARRRELEAACAPSGDAAPWLALVEHLVLVGAAEEALAALSRARGKVRGRGDPRFGALEAEALLDLRRVDEAQSVLEVLPQDDAMVQTLLGAAVLFRIRDHFASIRSATELIATMAKAFASFDHARAALPREVLPRARLLLVLGRVLVSTPPFLGARPQGKKDLEEAKKLIRGLSRADDGPLAFGGLLRLERTVDHFLARP